MKVCRGTYYVIRLLQHYYAGTSPIRSNVTTHKYTKKPILTKAGKINGYRYINEASTESVLTGEYVDSWTCEFEKAKQFRDKKRVIEKAQQLMKSNSTDQVIVLFFDGETLTDIGKIKER